MVCHINPRGQDVQSNFQSAIKPTSLPPGRPGRPRVAVRTCSRETAGTVARMQSAINPTSLTPSLHSPPLFPCLTSSLSTPATYQDSQRECSHLQSLRAAAPASPDSVSDTWEWDTNQSITDPMHTLGLLICISYQVDNMLLDLFRFPSSCSP